MIDETHQIITRITEWSLSTNGIADYLDVISPQEVVLTAQLYRNALLVFAIKMLEPSLQASDSRVIRCVERGRQLLDSIPSARLKDTTTLIWPICMLGIANVEEVGQGSFLRPLKFMYQNCGIGCVQSVMTLLDQAWESPYRPLGLDILFRDDLLKRVVF